MKNKEFGTDGKRGMSIVNRQEKEEVMVNHKATQEENNNYRKIECESQKNHRRNKKRRVRKTQRVAGRKSRKSIARRSRVLVFAISGTAVAVATFMGILLWNLTYTGINLNKRTIVQYEGFNTKGTADITFEDSDKYRTFFQTVTTEVEKNGNLSNGDVVRIVYTYDQALAKELNLKISARPKKVEVNGLQEGKEITTAELFENVQVAYEGTAPEISVKIENKSTDAFLKTIDYKLEDENAYHYAGEQITVCAEVDAKEAIREGYDIKEETAQESVAEQDTEKTEKVYTKEYTVADVDSYLTSTEQLSKEDMKTLITNGASLMDDATDYGLRIFSEANLMPIWVNNKTTFKWQNPRILSAYFATVNEDALGTIGAYENSLKLVYDTTLMQADGVNCQAEVVVRYTNLVKKADGTIDLALDSGEIISASYKNSHIKSLVSDTKDGIYTTEKIDLP